MFDNIMKIFKKFSKEEKKDSKTAAKERLHLVLMQDRANVSADFMELMKQEIIEVIKKYIDVDENSIDVKLTNKVNNDGTTGAPILYANIPILNVKDDTKKINIERNLKKDEANKQEEKKEQPEKTENQEKQIKSAKKDKKSKKTKIIEKYQENNIEKEKIQAPEVKEMEEIVFKDDETQNSATEEIKVEENRIEENKVEENKTEEAIKTVQEE